MDDPDLKAQFERGYEDAYANKPVTYVYANRLIVFGEGEAYSRGYVQGRLDRLSDIHEDHKFDVMNTNEED